MAYSQGDLDNLKRMLASGILSVEYNGRRVTYRTQAELVQAITRVEAELSPTSAPPRASLAEFDGR
jgi:hypothetical protein